MKNSVQISSLLLALFTFLGSSVVHGPARLSRAPAWKKSKPGRQWGLKLGSARLKARAAAWGESKGKGDSEGRHHNVGNRACCDVVPRRQHRVPG